MFVDSAKIYIEAGNGGNGSVSFHREKYVAAGGPDGGDGGRGGNVVFRADTQLATLMDFRYKRKYKAQNGEDGRAAKCHGRNGEDIVIKVPCGTVIKNAATGGAIADLTYDGEEFIAARGGNGGFGNVHFATPTRQVPRFAKPGLKGQQLEVILELKMLADVGLLGFPNVGKSTLLSKVSDAQPKIADYHFTTLVPNLGVVKIGEGASFVMADIPGLIEGASDGVGLGYDFLRHVERTRLLIHVVDACAIEGRNPIEDFDIINGELEKHSEKLASRQQIVVANKTDLGMNTEIKDEFVAEMKKRGYPVFEISAATGKGVDDLMKFVYRTLENIPREPLYDVIEAVPEVETKSDDFTVRVEDGVYVVEGGYIEYLINSTNFEDSESVQHFQTQLKRKGIIAALEEKGIQENDTVRLYDIEFDFVY
ncbi:MAG: GTPase ObgE [Clostridia bacterium]|nr:GTPase ObgE [Clostridia bacterium]